MTSDDRPSVKELAAPALAATLAFWALTARTHYPFLVDDYGFLARSYSPDFSLRDFTYILPERPLSTVINYFSFKAHLFEATKLPFLLYFFTHALGVTAIFHWLWHWLLRETGGRGGRRILGAIAFVICLFPDWFELTLMALNLPYSLGVPLLAAALWARKPWARIALLFASFCTLETYVLPALGLLAVPAILAASAQRGAAPAQRWRALVRAGAQWLTALAAYLLLQRTLAHALAATDYRVRLDPLSFAGNYWRYLHLLWVQGFYKENWISSAIAWVALAVVCAGLLRARKLRPIALLALLPAFGALHAMILGYYAPRAIHGAMVLEAVCIGVAVAALPSRRTRTLVLALLLLSYGEHYWVIANNRAVNAARLGDEAARIESALARCRDSGILPCPIDASDLDQNLQWDWIMTPTFHRPFVDWVNARGGHPTEVQVVN